ncbi:MAG TPA: site-2 protease family protein [Vicinamibacterales bacterium]
MDINFGQVFISFLVLVFSLTVHESAHAWAADRLGDPTARLLGRVSLNPLVHADPIGTLLFPLVGLVTGAPLIGWAKPVPVATWRFDHPRRAYLLVAAAGPISNLLLAFIAAAVIHVPLPLAPGSSTSAVIIPMWKMVAVALQVNLLLAIFNMLPIPPLDGSSVLAGVLPERLAAQFDRLRPYGFVLLYALLLSGGFSIVVGRPYHHLLSWLL